MNGMWYDPKKNKLVPGPKVIYDPKKKAFITTSSPTVVTDPIKDCVWMKDRFISPIDNGYRDIILEVQLPGTELWAEVQFHIENTLSYKMMGMHGYYDVARCWEALLPEGNQVNKIIKHWHTWKTKERWNMLKEAIPLSLQESPAQGSQDNTQSCGTKSAFAGVVSSK